MRSTANALSGVSLRYNVIGGFRSPLFRRVLGLGLGLGRGGGGGGDGGLGTG